MLRFIHSFQLFNGVLLCNKYWDEYGRIICEYRTGPCLQRLYNLVWKKDIKQNLEYPPSTAKCCADAAWCLEAVWQGHPHTQIGWGLEKGSLRKRLSKKSCRE